MAHSTPSTSSARSDRHPGDRSRGRSADSPRQLPKDGWRDVSKRTVGQLKKDNLSIVAAGVAFFAFLAIVPAMAAVIGLYGFVSDPGSIPSHLDTLRRVLPAEAMPLLEEQLTRISQNQTAAGWGATIGLLFALLSSLKGIKALMQGLNIAYDEEEKRGFIKLHLVALALTLGGILGVALLFGLVAIIPAVVEMAHLPSAVTTAMSWLRWPVMAAVFVLGLAVIYRVGPSRDAPRWRWVSPGATTGAALWLGGSVLFSIYVSSFGNFDKTYGSLGAVVVFLLWLNLSSFAILLGAEFNNESERQTREDTTQGKPEALGRRGAYGADTVGEST